MTTLILAGSLILVLLVVGVATLTRLKKCPPDKILVVSGKVGRDQSSKCIHGGVTFVIPVLQQYQYLDLTPMTIDIKLQDALSKQNIRVNTPSTFTIGVSTEPNIMGNAAERLLSLNSKQIEELAKDIIFGQMRVVIATMNIEQINADRDELIEKIRHNVEPELNKVGLKLINVNIQDVNDGSGYIEALGKEAAARAINDAKKTVAERDRDGEIGKSQADQAKRTQVASANAQATEGENEAKIRVANSDAERRQREAEAERVAVAAERTKRADAEREAYEAEQKAELAKAERERASQTATIVVAAEIEKKKVVLEAQAEAAKIFAEAEAKANGVYEMLKKTADGLGEIVKSAGGAENAAALLMVNKLEQLMPMQVEAVKGMRPDKVIVYDGGGNGNGKSTTANWISGMVTVLPQVHEFAESIGLKLPSFLGSINDKAEVKKPNGSAGPPQSSDSGEIDLME